MKENSFNIEDNKPKPKRSFLQSVMSKGPDLGIYESQIKKNITPNTLFSGLSDTFKGNEQAGYNLVAGKRIPEDSDFAHAFKEGVGNTIQGETFKRGIMNYV